MSVEILELGLELAKIEKAFNPNESRDTHGRWSSSGSGVYLEYTHEERLSPEEKYHNYDIKDKSNQKIGAVVLNVADPENLHVEWVGPHDLSHTADESNPFKSLGIGPSAVRDLARQLKRLYPKATSISGDRVSGSSAKFDRRGAEQLALIETSMIKAFRILCLHDDLEKIEKLRKDYDPDQPRDGEGRWTRIGRAIATGAAVVGGIAAAAVGLGALFVRGYKKIVAETAVKYGIDASKIALSWVKEMNGPARVMGRVNIQNGNMIIFPRNIPLGTAVQATVAHEATHLAEEKLLRSSPQWKDWVLQNLENLRREGGVSEYSKDVWTAANAAHRRGELRHFTLSQLAVKETVAEISAAAEEGKVVGGKLFRHYHSAIMAHSRVPA